MFAPAKSLTLYKDFGKDVKDLISKSYSAPQKWKIECKFRGPRNVLFINPTATSDGLVCTDVEFLPKECNAAMKVTVGPDLQNTTGTVSYTHKDHKVEAIVDANGKYELSHEMKMNRRLSSHARLVKDAFDVGLCASVARHCQVGCGTTYIFGNKKTCDWSVSCRYADADRVLAVRSDKLELYTTGFVAQVPTCPHPVLVGGEVLCRRGGGCNWTAGVEADCLFFKGNKMKARVRDGKEWALAYVARFADNWTAAVSIDKDMKPGVLLTHW